MDPKYKIEIARDENEVLALREDWHQMSKAVDADLDFYLTVLRTDRRNERPHVICVKKDGVVKAILIARIDKRPLEVSLGYKKLSSPALRFLTTVHGGLLGDDSEEVAQLLVDSIRQSLRAHEADVACFYGIAPDSTLLHVLRKTGSLFTKDALPVTLPRWRAKLPGTYDQFLKQRSSNTRHNIKRYSKRFEAAFGDQYSIRTFRHPDEIDTMLADTEAVACKTYHRGLGVGFMNDEQTREIAMLSAQQGLLRAHVLYVQQVPCAFFNGWLYRRTFFTWTTGFDPAFDSSRPGIFVLQHLFKNLCVEGADEVDFGFGDAQYKRDWCDYDRSLVSQLLFAPTLKSVSWNLVRSPLVFASKTARKALNHTNLLPKVKKAWRDRAAKTVPHSRLSPVTSDSDLN